jgi:hypothetical protein
MLTAALSQTHGEELKGKVLLTRVGGLYNFGSLHILDLESNKKTELVGGNAVGPCFSPDRKKIAYTDGNRRIYVKSLETGATKKIYEAPADNYSRDVKSWALSWTKNDYIWWADARVYDRVFRVKAEEGAQREEITIDPPIECGSRGECLGVIVLQVNDDGSRGACWIKEWVQSISAHDRSVATWDFANGGKRIKTHTPACMGAISPSGKLVTVNHEDHLGCDVRDFDTWEIVHTFTSPEKSKGYMFMGFRFSRFSEKYVCYTVEEPIIAAYMVTIETNEHYAFGEGYRCWDYAPAVVVAENLPPVADLIKPEPNTTVSQGDIVGIEASVSDDGEVAEVQFVVDGAVIETVDQQPYTCMWTADTPRTASLRVIAVDDKGLKDTSETIQITVLPETIDKRPFSSAPIALPGIIQAENFDHGGEGVSWHDNTHGNQYSAYRTDTDVDITQCGAGYCVLADNSGEWVSYSVNIIRPEYYIVKVAGIANDGNVGLALDGQVVLTGIEHDSVETGEEYKAYGSELIYFMKYGIHDLRVTVNKPGFILDYISFEPVVTISNPIAGQHYTWGDTLRIIWECDERFLADVYVKLSLDGKKWNTIAQVDINDQPLWKNYLWPIPLADTTLNSTTVRARIRQYGGPIATTSDPFTISPSEIGNEPYAVKRGLMRADRLQQLYAGSARVHIMTLAGRQVGAVRYPAAIPSLFKDAAKGIYLIHNGTATRSTRATHLNSSGHLEIQNVNR